ncbi:MAG: MgtC/SapB family protein [Actinobacteria bacterium]|nr:MgtC/SapB family protein [Actinomycetota bacterium]
MSGGEIILRLLMAAACGGLIGVERERGDRPAGFRTYIMISIGAALFTVMSLVAFPGSDPARIAAQVVVGIGFLGAGVIVVYAGTHVVGITTAATMWATAAVGMAAGAGYFLTCLYTTGIMLVVLVALPWVEERVIARFLRRRLYFTVRSVARPDLVEEVTATLAQYRVKAVLLRFEQCLAPQAECSLLLRANVTAKVDLLEVMEALRQLHGVTMVSFEE